MLFGGKKLPELMKGLGQGVQSFKKGMNDPASDADDAKKKDAEATQTDPTDQEK